MRAPRGASGALRAGEPCRVPDPERYALAEQGDCRPLHASRSVVTPPRWSSRHSRDPSRRSPSPLHHRHGCHAVRAFRGARPRGRSGSRTESAHPRHVQQPRRRHGDPARCRAGAGRAWRGALCRDPRPSRRRTRRKPVGHCRDGHSRALRVVQPRRPGCPVSFSARKPDSRASAALEGGAADAQSLFQHGQVAALHGCARQGPRCPRPAGHGRVLQRHELSLREPAPTALAARVHAQTLAGRGRPPILQAIHARPRHDHPRGRARVARHQLSCAGHGQSRGDRPPGSAVHDRGRRPVGERDVFSRLRGERVADAAVPLGAEPRPPGAPRRRGGFVRPPAAPSDVPPRW